MFNNLNLTTNNDFLGSNSDLKSVNFEFDYHSFYRAVVMANYDPENLGRIRICIPALHSNVQTTNQYPWAYPGCFVGFGNQTGQFILPPVGSVVFVSFEFSDEHRPIYFGGIPTIYDEGKSQAYGYKIMGGMAKQVSDDDIPTEYTGSQAIIYKSPTGTVIYTDDFTYEQKVVIQDSVGQQFLMDTWGDPEGNLFKLIRLSVDKDNYIQLEPNKVTWVVGGNEVIFDKDHPPGSGGGGTGDYLELTNKPQINGVTLSGNKTAQQLGLQTSLEFATNSDIDAVISL